MEIFALKTRQKILGKIEIFLNNFKISLKVITEEGLRFFYFSVKIHLKNPKHKKD